MPKIPYKAEKCQKNDEDYEIVSFEDFCDKSPGAKTDLLSLNDNINYRLHYESDKGSNFVECGEPSSLDVEMHTETSLNGPRNASYKRTLSFAPFGRTDKSSRGPFFSGVIPKPKHDGETSREHRYERFSQHRGFASRFWENFVNLLPSMLGIVLLVVLCIAAWWAVGGALGGGWGDDHYRKLWERAHSEDVKRPLSPLIEKIVPTENRYHDHNNLSTKNKINLTDMTRKKDYNKKNSYTERPLEVLKEMCTQVPDNMRFDCHPQTDASEEQCTKRGCCWKPTSIPRAPYCFYPPSYDTYHFVNSTESKHGMSVFYGRGRDAMYPRQFNTAKMDFVFLSDDILQVKITDAENRRFEPPYPEVPTVPGPISSLKYRLQVESSAVGFKVIRTSDNVTVVNTQNVGGLILSDRFLQISSVLPTDHVYGLGEKQAAFMNDLNWNTFTLFNRDIPPTEHANLYGSHPFYLALESDGNSHGMFLLNSNAMDIVLQPTPAITYRAIGGILNFYIFMGPTPKDVVKQYTEIIGRPFMPPYWSLGFHLCKYNYGSLNTTRDVMQRNIDAGIPLDVQWNDLDYMANANDFTYDKDKFSGLPQFVDSIHERGMHYVMLFDPGVSASEAPGEYPPFDRGMEMDVFIKNSTDQPFVGKVWNRQSTVWPDFFHPNATAYWKEMMADFHKKVKYDGAWIDMNEPSNFLSGSMYGKCGHEELPYKPIAIMSEGLQYKTLCMDAKHYISSHYNVHNIYAMSEAIATNRALQETRGRRALVLTRASSPGAGRVAAHWSGDVFSRWHDLRMSIPALLSFSLFGMPMAGADICGFIGDATPELCKRWMQIGAFYPFSRNHNSNDAKPQDPASMGAEVVRASRDALTLRYRLLPYYYTLFWRAHLHGDTVVRPLFFEFPWYSKVHASDAQFLVGPCVLVAGVLAPGASSVRALLPAAAWYSARSGRLLARDRWADLADDDMVALREGWVLPLQEPPRSGPVNTALARSGALQLLLAPDAAAAARGELYWDDGDGVNTYEEKKYSHIEFTVKNNELTSSIQWWGYGVPSISSISILGQTNVTKKVTINNSTVKFKYIKTTQVLVISDINLTLDIPFSVKWSYE